MCSSPRVFPRTGFHQLRQWIWIGGASAAVVVAGLTMPALVGARRFTFNYEAATQPKDAVEYERGPPGKPKRKTTPASTGSTSAMRSSSASPAGSSWPCTSRTIAAQAQQVTQPRTSCKSLILLTIQANPFPRVSLFERSQ